jgi:hypothetical protein
MRDEAQARAGADGVVQLAMQLAVAMNAMGSTRAAALRRLTRSAEEGEMEKEISK